jgi:hypothetical protein
MMTNINLKILTIFQSSLTKYESGKRGSRPVWRFWPTTAREAKNLSTEILT